MGFCNKSPTPVERVDGSPQLGLPSESLIKAEGFWDCYFLGMLCYVSKTLYFSSVFGSFVLEICVSPWSLGGGGFPPDAQDLHPQHHQEYLVAMNLSLSFADTSGVLLFQAMLELAC